MTESLTPKRVLITGAAGTVGSVLRAGLESRYELLRLLDIAPLGEAGAREEVVYADILDDHHLDAAMAGIDCVVHLAGVAQESSWERILSLTIDGCFRVFEAARRAGVKRIVYASSNHAVGFYPRSQVIGTDVSLRPDGRYGVSKAFGEALGRMYADKHGISVACVRIGSFRPQPEDRRQLLTWISHRDTVQLFQRCIEHPGFDFCVVYGVSNNERELWDNSAVAWLGYEPKDNAEDYADEILSRPDDEDEVARDLHGGSFCSLEFTAGR
ncbi:MAG: NAD(P)-dependent oxidoreductase [Chromatocurvus sp.]